MGKTQPVGWRWPFQRWLMGTSCRQIWRFLSCSGLGIGLVFALAACSAPLGGGSASKPDVDITLASFVVARAAHNAIIPKFQSQWQQEHNQRVHFRQSYGGSGSQTRAIIDGLAADVAHLALSLDTDKLVPAGLIQPDWAQQFPNTSIVSQSVAAIVVRPGNPKNIQNWADLARPDVQWITADPKTSGVARWNFLALWHAAIQSGAAEAKATEFLTTAFRNVPILARDAREATDVFAKGQGDALLNYENEVFLALAQGKKLEYVIPDVNISITNPIALIDKNVDRHGSREVAAAFVKFLYTPLAQMEFAKAGFRPIDPAIAKDPQFASKFPVVKNLGTVEDYGGWSAVQQQFFDDGALFDQIQTNLRS
ncbi:MAG: sulfate ABC transporter substrate-binding protein [Oscillatoriales cyanobacterium SM2_1_8]|nr:sulfate ABC transporter substrate-binding protein [Oscillatoriales cyanobacterium SM2_1_8]